MKDDLIGLEVVNEVIIKCGDCGTPLGTIIVTETNEHRIARGLPPHKSIFKIENCIKCNGSSFKYGPFYGSVIVGPIKDSQQLDIKETDTLDEDIPVSINVLVIKEK